MMWLLTLIVLSVLAWTLFRMYSRNDGTDAAPRDPLEHDRGGQNQPLSGQQAVTDGEVHDAARSPDGGHLEDGAGDGSAVDYGLDGTDLAGADPVAAGGQPAGGGSAPEGDGGRATNGDADLHRVGASVRTQSEPPRNGASVTDGFGDDAATLATPGSPDPAVSDPAAARRADEPVSPSERADAPDADTAGAGTLQDRSTTSRSNLVAGTVTLGIGGATSVAAAAVLANGLTTAEQQAAGDRTGRSGDVHGASVDAGRLAGVDPRADVREMMKVLNLRESDAARLDMSKDDFARLWQGDASAPDSVVEDAAARLRRMLD